MPLVSPETWAAARTAVEARRLGGPRPRGGETRTSEWVLRTVARCTCGALMGSAWSREREYLRCVRGCRPYVRVDEAEAAVEPLVLARLDELRELLARPSRRAAAADPAAALERLAGRRTRLAEAYELGAISREVLTERLARLDEDERRLSAAPVAAPPRREALAQLGAIRYRIVEDHSLPHVRDIVEDVYAEAMGENSASKDDVSPRSWETVTTFVATFPTEDGEGESVVEVQVGEGRGAWFVRTRDNDGGSDEAEDTAHPTYEAAVAAAKAMAAR